MFPLLTSARNRKFRKNLLSRIFFLSVFLAFLIVPSYVLALDSSLVGMWHMDGNWNDSAGTNHGTAYGSTSFVDVQSIATSGAMGGESFTIGTDTYLAVANYYNGTTRNINSKIYKWSGTSFVEFQSIATNGGFGWKSFKIGTDTYLAVANYHNDTTYNVSSKIYKWNGTSFVEFQSIATNGAYDWESFTIGADTYLAVTNYYNGTTRNINSKIYKWSGTSFVEFQSIATNGGFGWKSFKIGTDTYLAVANYHNDTTYNVSSKIYKWNGTSFVEFQSIATNGAYDWESFSIGTDTYLAVANSYNDTTRNINSKIYKWNGTSFVEFQSIATNGGFSWKSFKIGTDTYLAVANYYNDTTYNINSKIYKWNGTSFVEFQSIATNGARNWASFQIGADVYLAGTNYYDGASYNINSKIYKWAGGTFGLPKYGAASGSFDGLDDYLSLGVNSSMRQSSAITYEFWVNPSDLNTEQYVMGVGASGGEGYGGIYLTSNSVSFAWTPTNPQVDTFITASGLSFVPGTWYHIAIAVDFTNKTRTIYVNGESKTTTISQNLSSWTPVALYNSGLTDSIGGRYVNGWKFFSGRIDEVAVYNSALAADKIKAHYETAILTGAHLPNEISGLLLWYKADAITGLSDGSAVANWNDSSGRANNASQSSVSLRPIYKTNILNGKPVVRFDGIDDYMAFSSLSTIRTAVFVVNNTSTGATSYPPLLGHATLYHWHGDSGAPIFNTSYSSPFINNGSAFQNGTLATPASLLKSASHKIYTFKTTGNTNAQYITNDRNSATRVWKGDYAEIIIFDRVISEAERKGVEKYLADKYAIAVSHSGAENIDIAGQWHMDNNWNDSSGNANNGTAYNGATFSSNSKAGAYAGSFDGVDDYVSAGIDGTAMNTLSVEMWIMRKSAGTKGIFQWANSLSSATPFIYFYDANGTLSMYINGNYMISTNIDLNNWHHIVLTHDGSVWRLYKDGVLTGSYTGGRAWQQYAANIYFGDGYHGYWNGLIDEVAIYNRALSAEEIQMHAQTVTITPPTVDPVASPTAAQTITLSGTKAAGTSVLVNGVEIYPLDAQITWQGIYTLQSGTNTLNITAKDTNGFQSRTVQLTAVFDNTAPIIATSNPADNSSVNTTVSSVILNLSDAYSAVDLAATIMGAVVINASGQDILGTWATSGNSSVIFRPTNSFSEGTYTITIYPTDAFGNKATSQITFNYDSTAPPVPTVNTVSSSTNQSSQTLTGIKSADTTVITVTSPTATAGTVTYSTATTWSVTVTNLQAGDNVMTVTAKDAAGNISNPVSAIIVYDATPPSAPVVNTVASPTKDAFITFTGTKEANSSVLINGTVKVALDGLTAWQSTYNLQSGSNTLSITSKDAAGNQSSATSVTVILDNQAPVIESSSPANNSDTAKVVSSVTINLTDTYSAVDLNASIATASVKNSTNQTIAGLWTTSGTKTIIFTPSSPLPQDTYSVMVSPTDALGNTATKQIVFTNHDTTPPVTTISLSGTLGSDGWYSTTVTATLAAVDSADGSGIDKTEFSLDGTTWSTYTAPIAIDTDGTTTVRYRSRDNAGNLETNKTKDVKLNKSGIVGQWHMDNNWLDSSVMGKNGTANGATFSPDAKIGTKAGSFDGVNDYVQIPKTSYFDLSSDFTISFWLKRDASENGSLRVLMGKVSWVGLDGWYIRKGTAAQGSRIYLEMGNSLQQYRAYGPSSSTPATPAGAWQYYVFTRQGVNWKVYLDGSLQGSGSNFESPCVNNYDLSIGRLGTDASYYWHGLLDEVAVYNRVLSAAEILERYQTVSITPPTVDSVVSPTASSTVNLSGTKSADTSVFVNGIEVYPSDGLTTWQGIYALQPGSNTLNITVKSSGGYQSQPVTLTIVRDNTSPAISGSAPSNNASVNSLITAVTIQLADALSLVNLAATTFGATVQNSLGENIPGTWTTSGADTIVFTPSVSFGEGTYTVTVFPTDNLGNASTGQITFTYDIHAPPVPTINTITSPTKISSQTITGTKTTDTAAVIVTSSTAAVSAVTYPTSTTWSATVSNLQQGSNTITASARDAAGNQSDSITVVIFYDITAPVAVTVDVVQSPTRNSSVTLTGTKEANTDLYVNNAKSTAAFVATSWSYSANLSEGLNTFSLYSRDAAGNQGQATNIQIIKDTTPPRIASSVPAANGRVSQAATIDVFFVDDNSTVDIDASLVGATVSNSSNTSINGIWTAQNGHAVFTPSSALTDSVYTVSISPVDALGNKGTVSFSFTVDTAPPVVQSLVMSPTSPHKAEVVTFTITFNKAMATGTQPVVSFATALPYPQWPLAGGSWIDTRTWRANYSFTVSTGDGNYTVKITSGQDSLGNQIAPAEIGTFVLDTVPPAQPVINAVTSPTKTATQTISGTKPADTAIVINNTVRVALNASTTWSYAYPLSEGQNSLSIVARDAADNNSTALTSTIILDTTPPVFTVGSYQTPASSATQVVSGVKEPGCIVKVNGTQIFGSEDLSPSWSYTITLLQGISNHFVFTAADALGNTTTKTIDIVYDVSAPAQLGTGVLVADGKGKGTEISLSWSAYVESSDIAYYRVYMSNVAFSDTTGMSPVATTNKGVRSYKATGLTKGSTYYFGVVPVDASGNFDPRVNAASGIPTDTVAPEDVVIKTVTSGYDSTNGNFITITWTPSVNSSADLADQIVYFDSGQGYDDGASLGAAVATYTRFGLNDATRYKFRITVKDAGGHESTGVVTEGVTRLANPATVTAAPGNAKVSLSWTAVSSPYLKQYNVYRLTSEQQQTDVRNMTLIKTAAPSVTSFIDVGLTNGTTYQYAVTSLNTFGAERTAVSSVSAKPRMDETGPVISSFSLTNGQVVTAPITVTASATDAESSMGRLDLIIDNALVKSQTGSSLSYFYNAVETTDGNHSIKLSAYDQHGNVTEETRQFIVSLAAPAIPVITGHSVVQTTPKYLVTISGTSALSASVTLRLNNTVLSTSQPGTGTFSFTNVELIEGNNLIAVKASHRGGESPYSPDYKITVDTGAPSLPQNLAAQSLPAGVVRFTWTKGIGESPSGYNLYMAALSFTSRTAPGVSKVNSSAITYSLKEYTPPDDTLRYYAVTALDGTGNESDISNVVSATADRAAPSVTTINYRYMDRNAVETYPATVAGLGRVKVALTVSESLKEIPFFSFEPAVGSPIVVPMMQMSETVYEGSFDVTAFSPHGPTTYKFSAKDMIGNRGNAQGTGIRIDVQGPVAAIQSPLTALQITSAPTEVKVVFDEPASAIPVVELKSSNGYAAAVTNLASSDGGLHWTGNVDVSGLAEGNAEFILKDAKDRLGNAGVTVSTGRSILLYRDSVPSPSVPAGLTAKSAKGGAITLTWVPVSGQQTAVSYNLYRRAEAETTAVRVKTGMLGSPAQDTPPADGTYFYSLTSVGILDSESQKSTETQGISDRTGPVAPAGLTLSLSGSGVTAIWAAVSDQQSAVSYNLYRSGSQITSTSGLTPVAKVSITQAVDTAPVQAMRFYAVTAVDSLGNEGPLSETKGIVFPVSPVRSLYVERLDNAAPVVTWQPPSDGTITGYHIYRNGSRITQSTVIALTYTDGYYSGGSVRYGISAVDNLGNESPIKEALLPDLSISLMQGAAFRRGLIETIPVILTSNAGITIDTVSMKVGTGSESLLQGPFVLSANTALQLEKIAATAADAPSPVAVLLTASWSPSPGVSLKIEKTSSADVAGASTALEIFSDPLVRSTDVKVKLKVNNLGSGQMEFVTSENSSTTRKVKVILKDEDGNVLSTGYLDQRVGAQIVNTGSYAVARLNPGENILTDAVLLNIPSTAPYKVILEAVIDNTYYHYSKPDQVTAPGMSQSLESAISETAYRANAAAEHDFYAKAQPVMIIGQAISNTTNTPMAYVPIKVGISVNGFDRFYTISTDAAGNFSFSFVPGANEAGLYSVWAVHPDVKDRSVQSSFVIAGLSMTPEYATVRTIRNKTMEIPISLYNFGGGQLAGLLLETQASPGITATVVNTGDSTLTMQERTNLVLRITATSSAADTGYATLTARTAEGVVTRFDASISLVSAIPIISTTPSLIDTGMVRGNQKISSFEIRNTGEETLKNPRIEGPSTPWMTLTVNREIGDIVSGGSTSIGLLISPPETLAQGVYDDRLVIVSDNHIPYTYHVQVTVTSNAVGSVLFDVLNELMEDVSDATITMQHQTLTELIYAQKTLADGTVMAYDIPEGRYSFNISATGHKSSSGTFVIYPGMTTVVPIALEVTLVQVEWSVTPITIEDRYEIKITTTFVTNVPTPVLVIEPGGLTVPELAPGQVFNGEFTVSNYGLIELNDVNINFPTSFGEYDIELLATLPKTLNAMQKVTVPYRITRRLATASYLPSGISSQYACNSKDEAGIAHEAALLDEVKGYGGNPCYTSFVVVVHGTAVICPNTIQQKVVTKDSSYTVVVPIPGSNCSPSTGSGIGGGGGGGGGSYGGGGGGQSSGGGFLPGVEPTIIDPEGCGGEPQVCPGDNCPRVCTNSVVHLNNGVYEDYNEDIDIKINGFPLKFERKYVSRNVPVGAVLGGACNFGSGGSGSGGSGKGGAGSIPPKNMMTMPFCGADLAGGQQPVVTSALSSMSATNSTVSQTQSYGWTSPLFSVVKEVDGGIAHFDGHGHGIFFERDTTTGNLSPAAGAERYVAEEGITIIPISGGYKIKDKSGLARTYSGDRVKRLTVIENEAGNRLIYDYTPDNKPMAIRDEAGNAVLSFAYNGFGYLSEVRAQDGRTIRYQADSAGRLLSVEGLEGHVQTYEYESRNGSHLLRKKTDPEGREVFIEYKAGGLEVTKVTAFEGIVTQRFSYDFPNRVAYYTDPKGKTAKYDISKEGKLVALVLNNELIKKVETFENGRLEKRKDQYGNTHEIRYNERFDPIKITDPEGNIVTIEYNQYWKISKITDPLGHVTTFEYDTKGQITTVNHPDGERVVFEYDGSGNIITATKTRGAKTAVYRYEYDSKGNITKVTDPMGNVTGYGYDSYGHVSTITDANGNIYKVTADTKGRPITIENPLGNRWTLTYDSKDHVTTVTDAKGNRYAYTYDQRSKVTSVTDPLQIRTEYLYDVSGNLTTIKEAAGTQDERITTAAYDERNRLTSITDPMGNMTQYSYTGSPGCPTCEAGSGNAEIPSRIIDPIGNITMLSFDRAGKVTGVRDRNNNVTAATYDKSGKLTQITYPDNTFETYTYDTRGKLLTAANAETALTFTYNDLGKVGTYTDSSLNKTITYEYDNNGNRTKMTDPEGGVTTYIYETNRLKSITNPANKTFTFSYDELGRRKGVGYPNGVAAAYQYDEAGRLTELANKMGANVVSGNAYTYSANSNVLTKTDQNGTTTYQYDATSQLTEAMHPALAEAFTYDDSGNRITETRDGSVVNYTHTAGNRIETRNGVVYTHDANGNIISRTGSTGAVTAYEYDYANRLRKVTMPDGTIAEYKYDALWRRIEKTVTTGGSTTATRYLYEGLNMLSEYDGNNALKTKYTHNRAIDDPLAMERNGQSYYYHKDALGSITAITDSQANLEQWYHYDSFGKITDRMTSTFVQPYVFTGREDDEETGLYNYRFRYYDPEIGRFISEDPIGFEGGDVNLYSYVGNNPMNRKDPSGLTPKGYTDFNISFWVVTGGVMYDDDLGFYPYLGYGLVTPGISLTVSPTSSISTGWNIGVQGSFVVSGQYGITENNELSRYGEIGLGTPGAALSRYYVFKKQYLPMKPAACHKSGI